jgi:hypothetical protein
MAIRIDRTVAANIVGQFGSLLGTGIWPLKRLAAGARRRDAPNAREKRVRQFNHLVGGRVRQSR